MREPMTKPMTRRSSRSYRQRGFSLLEVLITIVVLSLGLLGFAGLQVYSLKTNRIAMQRSLATMYAYSMIDSMRANRVQALAGNYNLAGFAAAQGGGGTVALNDVHDWLDAIHSNLPDGQAKITVNGTSATIQIQWSESVSSGDNRTTAANNAMEFRTETSL